MQEETAANEKSVYILTGKIRTGKSSFLYERFKESKKAKGIITLNKEEGRVIYNLGTGEEIQYEVDFTFRGPIQKIGRYNFDEEAFAEVEKIIDSVDFSEHGVFILDEAGPLELNGKGFFKAIEKLVAKAPDANTAIIIVVREECVVQICDLFKIENPILIRKERFNIKF
jgi:nucleoside-triphosphatase THEP1